FGLGGDLESVQIQPRRTADDQIRSQTVGAHNAAFERDVGHGQAPLPRLSARRSARLACPDGLYGCHFETRGCSLLAKQNRTTYQEPRRDPSTHKYLAVVTMGEAESFKQPSFCLLYS